MVQQAVLPLRLLQLVLNQLYNRSVRCSQLPLTS